MQRASSTPACDVLGIKFTAKDEFISTFKTLTPEKLTNGVVYEIFNQLRSKYKRKTKSNICWRDVKFAVSVIYGEDFSCFSDNYMQLQCRAVKKRREKLRQSKRDGAVEQYMARQCQWKLPTTRLKRTQIRTDRDVTGGADGEPKLSIADEFTAQVKKMRLSNLVREVKRLNSTLDVLTQQKKHLIDSFCVVKQENKQLVQTLCAVKQENKDLVSSLSIAKQENINLADFLCVVKQENKHLVDSNCGIKEESGSFVGTTESGSLVDTNENVIHRWIIVKQESN